MTVQLPLWIAFDVAWKNVRVSCTLARPFIRLDGDGRISPMTNRLSGIFAGLAILDGIGVVLILIGENDLGGVSSRLISGGDSVGLWNPLTGVSARTSTERISSIVSLSRAIVSSIVFEASTTSLDGRRKTPDSAASASSEW